MQISAILIGLMLLAAVAYFVSRPIVNRRREDADMTIVTTLELRRDALYAQIRELDMDHATGKMNDEDYQSSRGDLVTEAAGLLRQIDQALAAPIVPASTATATLPAANADDVEAMIAARRKTAKAEVDRSDDVETAIAARRKVPTPSVDSDVETLIAARRKVPASAATDDVEGLIAARRKTVRVEADRSDDVEALIAARRKSVKPAPVQAACPNCGKAITLEDAFCSKCGTPLKAAAR